MVQNSVEVRNARLASFEATVGASPVLEFRTGPMPANTAAGRTGTILASMELPADWMAAPAGGAVSKAGSWQDLEADASGLAGYYCLWNAGKTICHEQGLLAQPWVASTDFIVGQQVNNGGNTYRCSTAGTSASSGGPVGNGTNIDDGTAKWNYVGPSDMIIDNGNIAAGQTVQVDTYSRSTGNA